MNRIRTYPLLFAFLAALIATPAWADFKRDYGNAMKAIQSENWSKASADLSKAIEENPDSAERVRLYGMRFDVYLPHYFLGEAKFRMGDCAGAVEAWNESLRRGVIQGQPQFGEMQANMDSCSGGAAIDVSAIAAAAGQAIDALKRAADDLGALQRDPNMGDSWGNFQGGFNEANSQVTSLRSRLQRAEGETDADAIEAIEGQAGQFTNTVNNLLAQARSTLEQNRTAATRARQDLIRAVASAKTADDKGSGDQRVQQAKQQLLALVNQADQLGSSGSVKQYQDLTRSIRNKERDFAVALQEWESAQAAAQAIARRTPPAELKQAAEAYFNGDYQQAVGLSDPGKFQESRARIQAHLFRAAARYHLYALNGESDRRLLQQVENDVRSIKRLDKNFSPYLAAFPPKFMSLFERI